MRIAIFSDVHGNLSGLQAVLADIERHTPDLVVFAGDLCYMGARPADCLRLVRERRLPSVTGNTDEWLCGRTEPPAPRRAVAEWARDQLSADERDWLARLPFALRFGPTARAADDLLIVHANPRDVDAIIFPAESEQITHWGHARQPDAELAPLLAGLEAAVMAYGHLHIPGLRRWGSTMLVNVSSVTMPGDGDGRSKYALLTWTGEDWLIDHHRVAYDAAAEIAAFRANRPPNWEAAVAELEATGYYYPQRI
jgi:predicted phosphodiesterase